MSMRRVCLGLWVLAATGCADAPASPGSETPDAVSPALDAASGADVGPHADAAPPPDTDADADTPQTDAAGTRDARVVPPADAASRTDGAALNDARLDPDGPACTPGTFDCPIAIGGFPYSDRQDTTEAPSDAADVYSCSDAREDGGEFVYRVRVPERGLLSATLDDQPGDAVDIDLHLLDAPRADACLARDNLAVARFLQPGDYYLVADTYTNADGVERAGPYTLTVDFRAAGDDLCALQDVDLEMVWGSCGAGIDCHEAPNPDGNIRRFLRTPATGPVVKEAHLVTVEDDFGGGWPGSFSDHIARHYALSEAASGYAMDRGEPWAPSGEGGSQYGQSAFGDPLPVLDEAWYVNMYWRHKPDPGTRMLIRNPANGRAVVASAGYETGPGSNSEIGGVTEEIHDALGTDHDDTLLLGFLVDQSLPLGPIDCP